MVDDIIGFLTLKGWKGVENIFFLVAMGTIIGIGLLYFFIIYHPDPKPKPKITVKSHLRKIIILIAILIVLLIL
ncbi:MAG: hypothetical protein GY940_17445 [bacterium]|nr:hypothetical protein [bacterium]